MVATRRSRSDAVGTRRGRTARRSAEAGQTRVGLGWAEAKWAGAGGGRCCRPGRLRPWAEKWGGGPWKEKSLFQIIFSRNFQILAIKYHFEQENDIFWKCPKNESCLEFNSLQLCFYEQSPILDRFWIIKLKSILTQNPNFWGIIFKAKFGNNLNTNLAPKIVLNSSRWFTMIAKHILLA